MTAPEVGGTPLSINLDVEAQPWTDLLDRGLREGMLTRVGVLKRGMVSGRLSVALIVELDDGTAVLAQTSWRLFYAAAIAFQARYGAPD